MGRKKRRAKGEVFGPTRLQLDHRQIMRIETLRRFATWQRNQPLLSVARKRLGDHWPQGVGVISLLRIKQTSFADRLLQHGSKLVVNAFN
jgi:hypothetical protein